jgi:twitching motility protein PilT
LTATQVWKFVGEAREKSERGGRRFRITANGSHQGPTLLIRPVERDARSEALALPGAVAALAEERRGFVLVTGPRTSVITDVLARLVATVAETSRRHVIAIDRQPIYRQRSSKSLVAEREVGEHTASYTSALRAALREDPDVIAIGQLGEPEAIATALLAAETGHLVIAGVHAADAAQAIRRLLAAQSASRRSLARATLANTLRAIAVVDAARGRAGWHVVADIVPGTTAVTNLIRDDRLHQLEATVKTQPGAVTRDTRLAELAATGELPRVVALERVSDSTTGLTRSAKHD